MKIVENARRREREKKIAKLSSVYELAHELMYFAFTTVKNTI
jgi:hypothetical protein